MTYARVGWCLVLVLCFWPLALGYVLRLIFGGLAAGAAHVATHLKYMAMPFVYALKRAKGFRRIAGAWVKPRPENHRRGPASLGSYRKLRGRP